MPQCAVATCKNSHRKTKGRRVRYHRFPAEEDVRKRWVAACGREGVANGAGFNTATARVCSLHFSPHSYERDVEHELLGLPLRSRLKRGAVPDRAVPISMPSLIGRKKPNARNRQSSQQQVNTNVGGGGRRRAATKPKPPSEEELHDVIDTSPSCGIDILLAVGLTPKKKGEEDENHSCLNRMHIMDDECSKSALEEPSLESVKMSPKICKNSQNVEGPVDVSKENRDPAMKDDVSIKTEEKEKPSQTLPEKERKLEQKDNKEKGNETSNHGKVNGVMDNCKSDKNEKAQESVQVKIEEKPHGPEIPNGDSKNQASSSTNLDIGESIARQEFTPSPVSENGDISRTTTPESQGADTKKIPETCNKRNSSDSDSDTPTILKKMKLTEAEYEERERTVNAYIEAATGTNLDELQRCTVKLHQEIQTLGTLAKTKEIEWNNIIRLKKVKEEMYLRLMRKKQIMLIMMGSSKPGDVMDWDVFNDVKLNDCYGTDNINLNKLKTADGSINLTKSCNSKYNRDQNHGVQVSLQQPSSTTGMSLLKGGQSLLMFPMVSSGSAQLSKSLTITATPSVPHSTVGNLSSLKVPDFNNRDKMCGRMQRPILPKPSLILSGGHNGSSSIAVTTTSANNGQNPVIGEGRQGPILDVRSIIEEYRSRHPETVPRRGRRMRTGLSPTSTSQLPENLVTSTRMSGSGGVLSMSSLALGSGSHMRTGSSSDISDLGFVMNHVSESTRQDPSRPSSADSCRSGAQSHSVSHSEAGPSNSNISFKDVLVQFAKLSQAEQRHDVSHPATSTKPPPYPEVTLHPVMTPHSPPQSSSSSLLHGILTKSSGAAQQRPENLTSKPSTFSPTLARLLTAPERLPGSLVTSVTTPFNHPTSHVSISDLLSSSKKEQPSLKNETFLGIQEEDESQSSSYGEDQTRSEITITPVMNHQPGKIKDENALMEEEQEDSADRLVIDESRDTEGARNREPEDDGITEVSAEEVPECQGCRSRAAQFVCAGCGNQWYCSRECQVAAWDEHSEVCSG